MDARVRSSRGSASPARSVPEASHLLDGFLPAHLAASPPLPFLGFLNAGIRSELRRAASPLRMRLSADAIPAARALRNTSGRMARREAAERSPWTRPSYVDTTRTPRSSPSEHVTAQPRRKPASSHVPSHASRTAFRCREISRCQPFFAAAGHAALRPRVLLGRAASGSRRDPWLPWGSPAPTRRFRRLPVRVSVPAPARRGRSPKAGARSPQPGQGEPAGRLQNTGISRSDLVGPCLGFPARPTDRRDHRVIRS